MAKKLTSYFTATLTNNTQKGGAWLAQIEVRDENENVSRIVEITAWKNASAGKRHVKERVQALTTRKSVKLVASQNVDEKGKPVAFVGQIGFKREA